MMVHAVDADAGLKALRLLKLHKHMEALSRENMMDFLYTVGMVSISLQQQSSCGWRRCTRPCFSWCCMAQSSCKAFIRLSMLQLLPQQ
jgi:hypothetical protein